MRVVAGFDRVLVADWSGGADRGPRPVKDAIWTALTQAEACETRYHRNRRLAEDWLLATLKDELRAGRRVLAGFDFPFGYPAGFAARLTGLTDPLQLWDWFAARLPPEAPNRFDLAAEINTGFPGIGPFWFNGLSREIPALPRKGRARIGHGMAERRHVETLTRGTFTCWQMGGAGAVGSQVMTGMAALSRLRAALGAVVAVWPFQPWDRAQIVLAEIWPSLIAAQIKAELARSPDAIKDEVQCRSLARRLASSDLRRLMAAATGPNLAEEGWILGVCDDPGGAIS